MRMKHPVASCCAILLAAAVLHGAARAADVVPITFVNQLPFVTVTVGATTSRLMIDSGGPLGMSIPETTASKAGTVTLLDQKSKFRDLQGQVYEVRNLIANQVVVGATRLGPVEGRVHVQWGGAPEGPDAELTRARQAGAIGLAAFGKRPVMFDYRLGTLTLYEQSEGPQAGRQGWQELPLEYGKEGPRITLTVNGKPLRFVLDTGAQVNLVNTQSLGPVGATSPCQEKPAENRHCDPRALGQVQDSHGRSLGPLAAERIALSGAPFDGILGAPFFQRYRVLFDLSARRLLIAPADGGSNNTL